MNAVEIPISVADFSHHMINYVKQQAANARQRLLEGGIESYHEYQWYVGYLRGLDEVASAVDAAARAAEERM